MPNNYSILIIDDDDAVRDSIAVYLDEVGYNVYQASDGEQGVALQQELLPDVVLCDLRMPKKDGISVLREINAASPDTPIIVISGAGEITEVVDALRFGANDYFIKPIKDIDALEKSISRCLEQVKLRKQNSAYREKLEQTNRQLENHLRILEQDQQAGRHVQMRLLPPSPHTLGPYTFTHRVIPSLYLSGDFVEYILVGDNYINFYIADISGHGASSAFVTAILKDYTAHQRSDYNRHGVHTVIEPIAFLQRANNALLDSGIGKHMTMCVGVLDIKANTLRYSTAGHLPEPILVTAQGAKYLPGSGMPVGLFKEAEFNEQTIDLPEKFTLYMFSDGILEILPAKQLVDKETALLESMQNAPQDLDSLIDSFGVDTMDEIPDDIAVLMVKRG
ncbi:MAG: sigma-B regulation protein RsbU (phosphoserine phosphatase) [Flavobacteriales bacterium]|jgi:serine phosphatase RsbU (regulator of sigma subunit)